MANPFTKILKNSNLEDLSPKARTKEFEGFISSPKIIGEESYKTVGWGFNLGNPLVKKLLPQDVMGGKRSLTKEEANPIFEKVYDNAEKDAKKFVGEDTFNKLPDSIKNTLVDMSYNMGYDSLSSFENMQKALKEGNYKKAREEMKGSKWFGQVGRRSKFHYENFLNSLTNKVGDQSSLMDTIIPSAQASNAPQSPSNEPLTKDKSKGQQNTFKVAKDSKNPFKDLLDPKKPVDKEKQKNPFSNIIIPERPEPINWLEELKQTDPTKPIPFLGGAVSAAKADEILKSFKRLQKFGEKYPETIEQTKATSAGALGVFYQPIKIPGEVQRKKDIEIVEKYSSKMNEEAERGLTFGANVVRGLTELPAWIGEFYLTGGLYSIGKKATMKTMGVVARKHLQNKAVKMALNTTGWAVGSAARTLALPQRVAESYSRRQTGQFHMDENGNLIIDKPPEDPATSLAKAWGSVFIEAASEQTGAALLRGAGKLFGKLPFGKKFMSNLFKAWKEIKPKGTVGQFTNRILQKGGYSNLIGEIGEERVDTAMNAVIGIESYGAGEDAGMFQRVLAGINKDIETLPIEATILAVPGAVRYTTGKIGEKVTKSPEQKTEELKERIKESVRSQEKSPIPPVVSTPATQPPIQEAKLIAKAKKYKRAEEFAESQRKVYHGGAGIDALKKEIKILSPKEKMEFPSSGGDFVGLSTTENINYAKQFSQNIANREDVAEIYIDNNAKVLKIDESIDDMSADELNKIANEYDVIESKEDNEIRILNPKVAKTKSQLTNIWKQAQGEETKAKAKEKKPGTSSFAPIEEPTRPEGEPGDFVKPSQIADTLSKSLDVPIKRGKFRQRALGIYKTSSQVIRFKKGGLGTISHEVGHHLYENIPELNLNKQAKKYRSKIRKLDYDKSKQRPGEGFSEFLRLYITDPKKAKDLGGDFYRYFEETISTKFPQVLSVLQNARTDYQSWLALPAEEKVKSQISHEHTEVKTERTVDKLYKYWIDELNPLTKYVSKAKKLGIEVKPEDNPDLLAHLFAGWEAKADQFLRSNTFNPKTLKSTGKSFVDIIQPIEKEGLTEDFTAYLVSRRALELSTRNIETGITTEDAKESVKNLEKKYEEFSDLAKELYDYQDRVLEYAKQNGLISQEMIHKMRVMNRSYVPFYRVMDDIQNKKGSGKSFASVSQKIKRIKGSEREIINPLESIVKNTYSLINASEKNAVNLAISNLARRDKYLERMFEKVPVPMSKVAQINPEEFLDNDTLQLLAEHNMDPVSAISIFRPSVFTPQDNTMIVFREGKKEHYEVDPDLYRALSSMDKVETNILFKILSKPASWLRAGAVLTPEFSLGKNPVRDQMTAYLYSQYGYRPIYDLMRGIGSLLKKDKYYNEWNRSGGPHAALVSLDRNYMKENLKDILGKDVFKRVAKNPIQLLRQISEISEEGTRLGEFIRGREKGATPLEAAMASKDVTINFSRKGIVGGALNKIISFFNANVQGPDKFYRSMKNHPGRTFYRGVIGITIPSIALYFYNKEYNPNWDRIPQWQKDAFWIIPVPVPEEMAPSGVLSLRLPKPFLPGILFGSLPERLLEYMDTKNPVGMKMLAENVEDSMMPGILPTALTPMIENMTNYSFFLDRPIIPYSEQRVEEQYQFTGATSETAKKLGQIMKTSPMKIDNLLRGYFAGLGKIAIEGIDKVLKSAGLTETNIDPKRFWFERQVVRAFVVNEPLASSSAPVNRLYDYFETAEKKENTYKKLTETNPQRAIEYFKQNPRLQLAHYYRGTMNMMSDFRNQLDVVYQDDNTSPSRKREIIRSIEEQMTKLAENAIKVEEQFMKNE